MPQQGTTSFPITIANTLKSSSMLCNQTISQNFLIMTDQAMKASTKMKQSLSGVTYPGKNGKRCQRNDDHWWAGHNELVYKIRRHKHCSHSSFDSCSLFGLLFASLYHVIMQMVSTIESYIDIRNAFFLTRSCACCCCWYFNSNARTRWGIQLPQVSLCLILILFCQFYNGLLG